MFGAAGRRERAGQRKYDNPLARKNIGAGHILPAKWIGAIDIFIADARFERHIGNIAVQHKLSIKSKGFAGPQAGDTTRQ